jgi:ABC-2 type transport system permease protein
MFSGIAKFEFGYQLRNPVFWVGVAIFFLMGFGITASENISFGTPGSVHENAPSTIASVSAIYTLFYLFVITSFVANAVIRDDVTGYGPIIRSTHVTRNDLVLGRFTGSFVIAALGFLSVPLGMAIGSMMPWVDAETIGVNHLSYYLWPYLIITLPSLFLSSSLLFGLATTTRSMMATYIGVVIFLMAYLITNAVLSSYPQYRDVFSQFEPLGSSASRNAMRYWTTAELNTRLVPLEGNLLFNRIFVIMLGIAILAGSVWRFSMSERAPSKRALAKLAKTASREAAQALVQPSRNESAISPRHDGVATLTQFWSRTKTEMLQVLKSPGLIVLVILAVINSGANLFFMPIPYGTASYPITADIISTVQASFAAYMFIIAVFYGGELVWRERDRKFNEIIDATPVADWVMIVPKILAVFLVMLILSFAGMLTGIVTQAIKGSTDLQIGNYLAWFILPTSLDVLLIAILAVFAQVISPNKYVGWGIMFIFFIGQIVLSNLSYDNELYTYGLTTPAPLSDMNGGSGFWVGQMWTRSYWMFAAILLIVMAHLIWPRGTELRLGARLSRVRHRLSAAPIMIGVAAIAGMIGTGLFIHHNFTQLNVYRTADAQEKFSAEYERRYLKYERLPRPSITAVTFDAQIFPKDARLDVKGAYALINRTDAPITDVHIRQADLDAKYPLLSISGARAVKSDKEFGYYIFRFDTPLQPGATATLNFKSQLWYRGFRHGSPAVNIVRNGTFVDNSVFAPIIGMNRNGLLQDRTKRRRNGLPAELRIAKLEDTRAQAESDIGSDLVTADITVSTDADQTPIAPGQKVSETLANGRRTVRFVSDAPVNNFFSIQSARYAVKERVHSGVNLAVYYHPAHDWNVDRMLSALATSLDYYQTNFGPYQFKQARIMEFPKYRSFAQSFANTIPYSESIGFASDVRNPEKIDYVTYVTAHELAHQYWGHQVNGANMQGASFLSESLSQYSALMVMKKLYGPDRMRQFLKYELDAYLSARKNDVLGESSLARVEGQQYIHYQKGSLVMYLLQERLGEAAVNRALARFVERFKFKSAPYPRSLDLIAEFRKEAKTADQQSLITDLFEKVTLYDLKAKNASSKKGADGIWETKITVEAQKYYATGKGNETKAKLAEPISIGLFLERPDGGNFAKKNILEISSKMITNGQQVIMVKSRVKPAFAGIDPYNLYVDRNSNDNLIEVDADDSKPASVGLVE